MTSSTAERLRLAVEDLLLERGQAATTLRHITERADANVAAVSYHFGSKDALIARVYGDALREVSEVQRRRLSEVPDGAPLEDLVRVWLAPALGERDRDPRETRLWALVQRGMRERAPGLLESLPAVRDAVDTHLMDRLAAALPHLSREELVLRHDAVLAAIGGLASPAMEGMASGRPSARTIEMIVAWVVGGLRAPAASHGHGVDHGHRDRGPSAPTPRTPPAAH
ncbi:TetR/AcrR family transcriptional regulator [Terrabacter sp. NPDC000476]|uniref:TetR/AcrR family transcriptional regulator n=1 Tax=Terrabacter sp. NPDC000476 TaxID=3154258 RepID=UPI00332086B5